MEAPTDPSLITPPSDREAAVRGVVNGRKALFISENYVDLCNVERSEILDMMVDVNRRLVELDIARAEDEPVTEEMGKVMTERQKLHERYVLAAAKLVQAEQSHAVLKSFIEPILESAALHNLTGPGRHPWAPPRTPSSSAAEKAPTLLPQAPAPSVQTDGAKTTPEVIHVEDAALLPEEEAHSIASSDV